jgi:hypothetical protein
MIESRAFALIQRDFGKVFEKLLSHISLAALFPKLTIMWDALYHYPTIPHSGIDVKDF